MADEHWNAHFRALWNHCSQKPNAVEDHPWGETVFKVGGKVFAFLGNPDNGRVVVKADADQLEGLLALPFIKLSPYIGRYGWVLVTISDDDALDLAHELVDTSYELISAKSKQGRSVATGPKSKRKPAPRTPRKKT